jgi:hypothetical protein
MFLKSIKTHRPILRKIVQAGSEKQDSHADESKAVYTCLFCLWSSSNSASKITKLQISTFSNFYCLLNEDEREAGGPEIVDSRPEVTTNGDNERSLNPMLQDSLMLSHFAFHFPFLVRFNRINHNHIIVQTAFFDTRHDFGKHQQQSTRQWLVRTRLSVLCP